MTCRISFRSQPSLMDVGIVTLFYRGGPGSLEVGIPTPALDLSSCRKRGGEGGREEIGAVEGIRALVPLCSRLLPR